MSAKEIVTSLRQLASEPTNRQYIVKDQGCLPGLVVFLSDVDGDVVFAALETVFFLSQELSNRASMAGEVGLLKAVKKLMVSGKLKEKKLAIATYTNLQSFADKSKQKSSSTSEQSSAVSSGEPQVAPVQTPAPSAVPAATSSNRVLQAKGGASLFGGVKSARTYSLYVTGLTTDAARVEIEALLLHVKGVISFFFDLAEQKVVIRTSTTPEEIVERLASAGLKASTQRKEILPPAPASYDSGKENEPQYLQDGAEGGSSPSWFGLGTIISYGHKVDDSQAKKGPADQNSGWFSRLKLW